ncbi:MAG TPA: flagellar biosynthetic protein FliO [Solirubrobacteraceae bacterium]|nr:flagellar biosynthetic protein FliO [Solirubrobacteraceae bacterium]
MTTSPSLFFVRAGSACLTLLLVAAPTAFAAAASGDDTPLNLDDAPSGSPAEKAAETGGGGGIARMVVGLALVLGVIYGLSWVLKQVKSSKEGEATGHGMSQVSSLPLGPGRSVHLLRVGDELLLVGSAEKGVTPLRRYGLEEAAASGLIAGGEDGDVIEGHAVATVKKPVAQLMTGNLVEAIRQRTVRR